MLPYSLRVLLLHLLALLPSALRCSPHAAKRSSPLTIQDICGRDPVDCGSGWCCLSGQKCLSSNPPTCKDLIIPSYTMEAIDYSSAASAWNLGQLTSVGLTLSTFPSTTLTGTTALPSYSDNTPSSKAATATGRSVASPSSTTNGGTRVFTAATGAQSTGAAAVPTLCHGVFVGGLVGAGLGVLAGI